MILTKALGTDVMLLAVQLVTRILQLIGGGEDSGFWNSLAGRATCANRA